jgi:hypothetical protein
VTSPLRGPQAQKEAASPPLIFRHAAHATGPPLRPQRCSASRCAGRACGAPLTPETAAAPGSRKSGPAQACPRAARGAQTPAVAGHRSKPDVRAQVNWRSIVRRNGKITNLGWCQGSSEADPSRIK